MSLHSRSLAAIIVATFAVTLPATTAVAQPTAESDRAKTKMAKGYVDAGLAAQDSGDHATAIELFTKAYGLVPHPVLLFNLGQAHRLAGHREDAKDFYRKFLATKPKGEEARIGKQWLDTLEAEDAAAGRTPERIAEEARRAAEERAAAEARQAEATRSEEAARQAAAARVAEEARQAELARQSPGGQQPKGESVTGAHDHRGRKLRLAGLGLGAAGVAVAATGVVMLLIDQDCALAPGPCDVPPSEPEFRNTGTTGAVLTGVGAAVVGVGAFLYLRGGSRAAASPTAWIDPGRGGGVGVVGRF